MCNGDDDNFKIITKDIILLFDVGAKQSCYLAQSKRHQKYYPLKFVLCNSPIPLILVQHEFKIR